MDPERGATGTTQKSMLSESTTDDLQNEKSNC
jgi:hypothetical protein